MRESGRGRLRMRWKNSTAGFGIISIALHWLVVVLVVAAYCAMEFKSVYPKGSPGREAMAQWHYMLGLSVFALVWLRLIFRWAGATPVIEPAPPKWQATLATAAHWALYVLLVALPLVGWAAASAKGVEISLFAVQIPPLLGTDKALSKTLKDIHEAGATIGYFLIGLHAAAALFHHYILRDNTLRMMLPARR